MNLLSALSSLSALQVFYAVFATYLTIGALVLWSIRENADALSQMFHRLRELDDGFKEGMDRSRFDFADFDPKVAHMKQIVLIVFAWPIAVVSLLIVFVLLRKYERWQRERDAAPAVGGIFTGEGPIGEAYEQVHEVFRLGNTDDEHEMFNGFIDLIRGVDGKQSAFEAYVDVKWHGVGKAIQIGSSVAVFTDKLHGPAVASSAKGPVVVEIPKTAVDFVTFTFSRVGIAARDVGVSFRVHREVLISSSCEYNVTKFVKGCINIARYKVTKFENGVGGMESMEGVVAMLQEDHERVVSRAPKPEAGEGYGLGTLEVEYAYDDDDEIWRGVPIAENQQLIEEEHDIALVVRMSILGALNAGKHDPIVEEDDDEVDADGDDADDAEDARDDEGARPDPVDGVTRKMEN